MMPRNLVFLFVVFLLSPSLLFCEEPVRKIISSNTPWVATGIQITPGENVWIDARGTIQNTKLSKKENFEKIRFDLKNGPNGTFYISKKYKKRYPTDQLKENLFPLPAADEGKWPAYALIGKIGEAGRPFFVGETFRKKMESSGELFLGTNDFDFTDNTGAFEVIIEKGKSIEGIGERPVIQLEKSSVQPPENALVILVYVDGLRPDTVEDMAALGHLPNIKELFFDKGLQIKNCFTVYESNTVVANSVFMTGRWPNETGIKNQAFFERFPVRKRNWFKEMKKEKYPRQRNLLSDIDIAPRLLKEHNVKAFYDYLGDSFLSTVAPINPETAPLGWPHTAVNTVENPFFTVTEAYEYIDEVNGEFLINSMANDPHARVILTWLPGLDNESHKVPFGQFGGARHNLVGVDTLIGNLKRSLEEQKKWDRTYLILFADHGSIGGDNGTYNQNFNVASEFFFKLLKMNVRNTHFKLYYPGTNPDHFTYVDNMGRGQAKIYLPVADSMSGNWSRPNTLYELQHYGLGPNREKINLIDSLVFFDRKDKNVFPDVTSPFPIDVLMIKIKEGLIFVKKQNGSEALIWSEQQNGKEKYRYMPVKNVRQDQSGEIHYEEVADRDPFGYVSDTRFNGGKDPALFLSAFHDSDEWLQATYQTEYPDAPVVLSKIFAWRNDLKYLAPSRDPDILLSANTGWNFYHEVEPGTDHGYLKGLSMKIPFFIHGPHVRHGVVLEPHRLIQLTPTVFKLIHFSKTTDFSEKPIEGILN